MCGVAHSRSGSSVEGANLRLDLLRHPSVVRIEKAYPTAPALLESAIPRRGHPTIGLAHVPDLRTEALSNGCRLVRRSVVDDNYFDLLNRLRECAIDGLLQKR